MLSVTDQMNSEFAFDLCSTRGKKETGQSGSLAFGNVNKCLAFGGILKQTGNGSSFHSIELDK